MHFHDSQHQSYCGVDLHARSMYTHILDASGTTVFDNDLSAAPAAFLDAIKPFRDGLVACACLDRWFFLAPPRCDALMSQEELRTHGHQPSRRSVCSRGGCACRLQGSSGGSAFACLRK